MKLTSICYYNPEPRENDIRCSRCGRYIQYTHIVLDDIGNEIPLGMCCVRKLRAAYEINGRLPRNGYYNWKMSDVRQAAYWDWYSESISHAQ